MKKTFMTLCLVSVSLLSYSQVGISTSNPQGTLHVDGAKDNPDTGVPNASQQSNDFTVTNLGRVGIGTTNPAGRWHLYNPINGTETGNDYLIDDESPISQTPGLVMRRSNAGGNLAQNDLIGAVLFNPKINGGFSFGGAGISGIYRGDGTTFLTALAFRINNNLEDGRFAENGFMGIGTANPKQQLHIVESGATSGITTSFISGLTITGRGIGGGYNGPGFYLENADAAAGSKLLKINYTSNGVESILNFQNVTDDASATGAQTLTLTRSGRLGILNINPVNNLSVNGNTSIGNGYIGIAAPTNGAIIQGDVGIGTSTLFSAFNSSRLSVGTTTGTGIHVRSTAGDLNGLLYLEKTAASTSLDQFVFFRANGSDIGNIIATGPSGVAYNTTSDMRLKENVTETHYSIDDVMKIQVRDYNYKADKNNPQTGFIAQQLYTIFPNAVTVGGEDVSKPWMVDYSKIAPLLTKAIQDQQGKIETQQKEIDTLREELDALKNMLKAK
jgi:hypothetical protein